MRVFLPLQPWVVWLLSPVYPHSLTCVLGTLRAEPPSWACDLCSHTGSYTQKGLTLGLLFCCHCPEILHNFRRRGLTFSFCTGPCKLRNQFCLNESILAISSSGKLFPGPQEGASLQTCSSGPFRERSFPSGETSHTMSQSFSIGLAAL